MPPAADAAQTSPPAPPHPTPNTPHPHPHPTPRTPTPTPTPRPSPPLGQLGRRGRRRLLQRGALPGGARPRRPGAAVHRRRQRGRVHDAGVPRVQARGRVQRGQGLATASAGRSAVLAAAGPCLRAVLTSVTSARPLPRPPLPPPTQGRVFCGREPLRRCRRRAAGCPHPQVRVPVRAARRRPRAPRPPKGALLDHPWGLS
jgi:hypothetical protein